MNTQTEVPKKIEVLKSLLNFKAVEERIDKRLKEENERKPLTPTGHRKTCRCR